MENNTRKLALQQMLLFTVGSSFFLGSCKTTSTKSTAAISHQPLKPVHVLVGDTVTELHAGDYHLRPHGIVHTFWNSGDVPARFIDMYPNQDFISFFEEFVRIENRLQKKGLTMQSPEALELTEAVLEKFGAVMFYDQFPPILEKYGLKT